MEARSLSACRAGCHRCWPRPEGGCSWRPRGRWVGRGGAITYGLGIIVAWALPTPVGSNVGRLGELLAGPLLAGLGSGRHRWLLAAGLAAAAGWQVAQPAADFAHGNGPGHGLQTAALVSELRALHADTGR